ncbi:Aste57867_10899 [Aphanomyces stellatus]|uniref:Aste57867_10899 protein n=1 Tax=Aphanomyces stellatus TaxID=120398 RepID=A0A485KS91_9STRA|nr:hypothetical protein As57867_010859 [Aphanomyces stellatus]VFT87767.1 Aste57867_10899 [Aphanomyces stellatus]
MSAKVPHERSNYLETLLRNVDWTAFLAANGAMWQAAVAIALLLTVDGSQWLADRPHASQELSVDDEVAFLTTLQLTRYELQYRNEIAAAITDHDAALCAVDNRQLVVRSAANNFDAIGLPMATLFNLQDTNGEFVDQVGLFYHNIGPFGAVDILCTALPPPLRLLYNTFSTLFAQQLGLTTPFWSYFANIPSFVFLPVPPTFIGMSYPESHFSFDDSCATPRPFTLAAFKKAMVFALVASQVTQVDSVCVFQDALECVSVLMQIQQSLATLGNAMQPILSLLKQTSTDIPLVQFTQYAQDNSSYWLLHRQPLLTTDPNWSFYGWLAIFGWIEGTREVIRLDADERRVKRQQPNQHQNYVVYVSAVLVAVASVVIAYTLRHGFDIMGRNLFLFNRVVGCIWIGRPLLFLRGFTAILVLSSNQVDLVHQKYGYS